MMGIKVCLVKLRDSGSNRMDPLDDYPELVVLLRERGHSDDEIKRVLERVRDYDDQTKHDSVMDSIGAGRMSLEAIIQEALND